MAGQNSLEALSGRYPKAERWQRTASDCSGFRDSREVHLQGRKLSAGAMTKN
jgi:hypothetical protein